MSTLVVDTLTNQEQRMAKAWVSYNGVSNTIKESYNVSSVTDVSTGQFEINLITPMNASTYCVTASMHNSTADNSGFGNARWMHCAFPYTNSIVRLTGYRADVNANVDHAQYGVAVFGN